MPVRANVQPALLRWARHRARLSMSALASRFPKLEEWEAGREAPTLRQLEAFARATHTSVGYLFLSEAPAETVPIPDFRTHAAAGVHEPSANLLDTLYVCQQRQEWYREFARATGEIPLPFVGSLQVGSDEIAAAAVIRDALKFDVHERRRLPTWEEALRRFTVLAEDAGILVMCSGIVLNNSHRPLDVDEFRGFALADVHAPLVFINGADTKSGQMFTLAHELVHLWIGQSALSDARARELGNVGVERWCNAVAAELLVPDVMIREVYDSEAELSVEVARLARMFKVSALVVLRRIHDIGGLTAQEFWVMYDVELARLGTLGSGDGGNFHATEAVRVSKRFARAIVESTLEVALEGSDV